jgi:hypothetical protein
MSDAEKRELQELIASRFEQITDPKQVTIIEARVPEDGSGSNDAGASVGTNGRRKFGV